MPYTVASVTVLVFLIVANVEYGIPPYMQSLYMVMHFSFKSSSVLA